MVLVFLLCLLLLVLVFALTTTIKINIRNLEISNEKQTENIIKDMDVEISLYVLNKLRIYAKTVNKFKLEGIKSSKSLEKIKSKYITNKKSKDLKAGIGAFKNLKIKLQELNLEIYLGTEDVILTSFLIFAVSTAISIFLSKAIVKFDEKKYRYLILPKYNNENSIKIILKGILEIKLVNIINILFKLFVRGDNIVKRTSNRRAYGNNDEQYTRNDRCKYNYRRTN